MTNGTGHQRGFNTAPTVLICEPHREGHHGQYLRWAARGFLERGCEVWLALPGGRLDQPGWQQLREEYGRRIRTLFLPPDTGKPEAYNAPSLVRLQLRYHRMFDSCYRQLSKERIVDYAFVPYLDYCLYAAALLGSPFGETPWGGIAMRPSFHLKEMGIPAPDSRLQSLKKKLFFRLLRRDPYLHKLFTIDEPLEDYAHRSRPSVAGKLRYLPDPVELNGPHSRESARKMLGIPEDRSVVLVYGALSARKGLDALLAGACHSRTQESKVSLLLAGVQDAGVEALLDSPEARKLRENGRLYELNRFVSGEEEHAVFQAADLAWLGYRGHYGGSGVLAQAAAMGLPVIACEEGLIGWLTRKHGLGLSVDIDNASGISEAILKPLENPGFAKVCADNGRRWSSSHSISRFLRAVGEQISTAAPRNCAETEPASGAGARSLGQQR
jgi:glycosyltransferase involved in cell wall biosynthesis